MKTKRKIVRLRESDLHRLVNRVLNEQRSRDDSQKIEKIKSVLDYIDSNDIDKIYKKIEDIASRYYSGADNKKIRK